VGVSASRCEKLVILAAGLGTRMRREDGAVSLDADQAATASAGLKAMIRIDRPFLDYVLHAAADSGFTDACLVIGPEHDAVREYYSKTIQPRRLRIGFAIQQERRGTAHAVLQAEPFVDGDPFVMINSDNYYPPAALAAVRRAPGPAVAGFTRAAMAERSNIAAERLAAFALIVRDESGCLERIIEKPDPALLERFGEETLISMNCWRFGPSIFDAAGAIAPSPRGELEITDAVQHCIEQQGERFTVYPIDQPVLDMSSRSDIPAVVQRLAGSECEP
jgi:dTDP-glucose pyrophosphorylase